MLLARSARADDNAQACHRDPAGRQWAGVFDQAGSYRLRRFDSGTGGGAWVASGTSDGGPVGLGVLRVSADGQSSSAEPFYNRAPSAPLSLRPLLRFARSVLPSQGNN